ncbi:MAG: hypothetical protein ACTSRK_11355 [Promethearchaeota archaeon]
MQLIYFDTCSLRNIEALKNSKNVNLYPLLSQFRIGNTSDLESEYNNYRLDLHNINFDFYAKLDLKEIEDYKRKYHLKEFDDADISLFIMGKRDGSTIVTDDRPLFFQCIACNLDVFLFPNFLLAMADRGFIKKNMFFKCLSFWEEIGRYSKQVLKEIKEQIHSLS